MRRYLLALGLLLLLPFLAPSAKAEPTCSKAGEVLMSLGPSRGIGCSGATPLPTVATCGTTPAFDANASNFSGTVTVGTGATTACTVTFGASFYPATPHCLITVRHATITAYLSAASAAAFTATFSADAAAQKFDYICSER